MGFDTRVILHVTGILATMLLLGWSVLHTQYYATMLVLCLALLVQVAALLRLVHTTNRELARFLEALQYMDLSQSFGSRGKNASFRELSSALNTVADRFRIARSEREQQAAWLQSVVQHLPVAVLVLDDQERVLRANTALQRLLGRTTAVDSLAAMSRVDAPLADAVRALQPGGEHMLKRQKQSEMQQLKLSCTLLRSAGQLQKLVCIQNIEGELEGRELDAWQNLIRVMTHEIMNSVTPLTSLAETAGHYVDESRSLLEQSQDSANRAAIAPLLEDAASAVVTIGKRGQGLLHFVTSYRTLSRLPMPVPTMVPLQEVFHSILALLAEQAREVGVKLVMRCRPDNLQLLVDAGQLEQALINLLRNALDACVGVEAARVELTAALEEGGLIVVSVSDNGCGISTENLDNIFVPFFTTKRNGSGVGMSMVKQIVRANHGRIGLSSTPGSGTTIRISFRQY